MLTLVWEVFHMSVFIALASYCLHFFAYKKGLGEDRDDIRQTKNNDDIENANGFSIFDIVLDKWLNFGGGYYGTVAFVKLIGIEILQLGDLFANWQDTDQLFDQSGVQMIVAFFINQYQSFVAAIIWPTYYLSDFTILQCAIFVVTTYGVYEYSRHLAKNKRFF